MSIEFIQFRILPFGSVVALLTILFMWRLRHRRSRLATLSIAISGLAGDFALVVTLRAMHRLPLLVPCFDCGLLSEWWYSDAITFVQGFGIMAGLALLAHWLSRRSPSTSKA